MTGRFLCLYILGRPVILRRPHGSAPRFRGGDSRGLLPQIAENPAHFCLSKAAAALIVGSMTRSIPLPAHPATGTQPGARGVVLLRGLLLLTLR